VGVAATVVVEAQDQSKDFMGVAIPDHPQGEFDGEPGAVINPRGSDFIRTHALRRLD